MRVDHFPMTSETPRSRSRFLLLPELGEPAAGTKQAVVRRYSLTRLPAPREASPSKAAERRAG